MKTEFTIGIAGVNIGVTCVFESTRLYCRDYLTDAEPELRVETTLEEALAEQTAVDDESTLEGIALVEFPPEYLETLALYRKIVEALLPYGILLMHGSVVAVDDQAYLFTAVSGTGKSTHTRLWRKKFGARAVMVNDDKPLLRFTDEGVLACGTPWNGKHRKSTNIMVPLKAVCILERGETNGISRVPAAANWPMLMQQIYRPKGREGMNLTMGLLKKLMDRVELYRLHCNMDPEAAEVAYNGMNGGTL